MTEPYAHQNVGVAMIDERPAILLHWDMGCMKTRTFIDWLSSKNGTVDRVLIVAPKMVCEVWRDEFALWAPDINPMILDEGPLRRRAVSIHRVQVVVINYEAVWQRELGEAVRSIKWDAIVVDEGHRLKAPFGKMSRFMAALPRRRGQKRIALTGTPMPHSPIDIFGLYRFLDPDIYGWSFVRFRSQYAVLGGRRASHPKQIMGYKNLDELREKMQRISHRVRKDDVLDLPPFTHQMVNVQLGTEAQRIYSALDTRFHAEVRTGEVTAANALVKTLRLAQTTSGFVKDENGIETVIDIAKREALAELLESIGRDRPVVVFCRFHQDLDSVHEAATKAGRTCHEISGRRKELAEWINDTQVPGTEGTVAAIQIQSGKEGLNALVRANYCVYFSTNYSLGDYDQSAARLHRPGQKCPVTYIHLICRGTVDEDIYAARAAGRKIIDYVLEERYGARMEVAV